MSKMPRVMVERFVKEHLRADDVVGTELAVNRFGFATGFVDDDVGSISGRVTKLLGDEQPTLGLARPAEDCSSFLSLCKVSVYGCVCTIHIPDIYI